MDDTVLFTDVGIVVFVIIASATLMLSVLALATRAPFGTADYPIFKTQSGSFSVNGTLPSDPRPPISLIFSENLSNEVISPKQLPETMRVRLTLSLESCPQLGR